MLIIGGIKRMQNIIDNYLDISNISLVENSLFRYERKPKIITKHGQITEIWTGENWFEFEDQKIEPFVFQNCMNPKDKKIQMIHIYIEETRLIFERQYEKMQVPLNQSYKVKIHSWTPYVKKKSCHPCTNCGACSW